jgi:hypothetical protein
MNHLCQKKKLHWIPIFETDPCTVDIPKYFVGLKKFETFGSKYSTNKSKSVDSLAGNRIMYLSIAGAEDTQAEELQKEISDYETYLDSIENQQKATKAELGEKKIRFFL